MSSIDQRSAVQVLEDAIVKQRVLDGIALLQQKFGDDWAKKIDLNELALSDSRRCVLGQLFNEEPVTEEQAVAWAESPLGRTSCYSRENAVEYLNSADGYVRGTAILDGPLTSSSVGPEMFGFNELQLWLSDLDGMSNDDLAELGATREQVEAARAEATASPRDDLNSDYVGVSFGSLDDEWRKEIRARR